MPHEPYVKDADLTLYIGDALEVLAGLPDGSVDCCVTSPPYWGLRDYGVDGQLGLEPTPDLYVAALVAVFSEVRRVLADTGTVWLNLGDSYVSTAPGTRDKPDTGTSEALTTSERFFALAEERGNRTRPKTPQGLKPKDLVGIPWRVAFTLQADGWYLRSDIVWSKPNPMPESVTDRPTKSHEYVFLLSKQPRYFFDQEAVREPAEWARWGDQTTPKHNGTNTGAGWIPDKTKYDLLRGHEAPGRGFHERWDGKEQPLSRNVRSVWEIPTQPYAGAHFATYPEELVRRCILAGCPEGGTVLDPFAGSGTTGLVARKHGRKAVLIELSEDYCKLAARRLQQLSLLAEDAS